jgi:c-di-GMP-binding flagellar brake protein YcgR
MIWNGIEKRRFVRANFPCKIAISTPTKHTIITHTENIGAGGVRVIIDEELDISLMVGLEIHLNNEMIKSEARIVWAIEAKKTSADEKLHYDTGIEFYKIDEEDRKIINNFVEAITPKE